MLRLGWKAEEKEQWVPLEIGVLNAEVETDEPSGLRSAEAVRQARVDINHHVATKTPPERVLEAWERGHGHPWFNTIKGLEYEFIDMLAPEPTSLLDRIGQRRSEGWDCWIKGKFDGTPIDSALLFRPIPPHGLTMPEDGSFPAWSDSYELLAEIADGTKPTTAIWQTL